MIIDHLDACARELIKAGIPCNEYQMWVGDVDGRVHYWFGFERGLEPPEDERLDQILTRYLGEQ